MNGIRNLSERERQTDLTQEHRSSGGALLGRVLNLADVVHVQASVALEVVQFHFRCKKIR